VAVKLPWPRGANAKLRALLALDEMDEIQPADLFSIRELSPLLRV
jgi:hypothetical protein